MVTTPGAVVVTITETLEAVDPFSVTEPGVTEHVASDGAPLQANVTA